MYLSSRQHCSFFILIDSFVLFLLPFVIFFVCLFVFNHGSQGQNLIVLNQVKKKKKSRKVMSLSHKVEVLDKLD